MIGKASLYDVGMTDGEAGYLDGRRPLALLVFLLVWRSLAAAPSSLSKESVDPVVGVG